MADLSTLRPGPRHDDINDGTTTAPPEYSRHDGKADVLPSYEEITGTRSRPSQPLVSAENHVSASVARRRKERCRPCQLICAVFVAVFVAALVGGIVKVVLDKKADARKNPQYKNLKYRLVEKYSGDTFFDNFDHFTDSGAESFTSRLVNATEARRRGITSVNPNGDALLSITANTSARIVSKRTFSSGLFVFQIANIPRHCTYVPTLRLSSSASWPAENDIRIHYHQAHGDSNQGIRTSGYCNMDVRRSSDGIATKKGTQCNLPENDPKGGCRTPYSYISSSRAQNVTLIMELQPAGVRYWHSFYGFSGIDQDAPDPSRWGVPKLDFPSTDCDMQTYFRDLRLVADINVCGDYGYWGSNGYEIMGDWCQKRCQIENSTLSSGSSMRYQSTNWQWNAWKIYEAVP